MTKEDIMLRLLKKAVEAYLRSAAKYGPATYYGPY